MSGLNRVGDDCFRLILQYTRIPTIVTTSRCSQRIYRLINHIVTQYLPVTTLNLRRKDLCQRYSQTQISTIIPRLELINGNCDYDYHDLEIILRSKYLRFLDLSKNFLGVDGMKVLAPYLTSIPKLQTLNLDFNGIDSEGIVVLTRCFISINGCSGCPQLQSLSLSRNQIGVEGVRVLASHLASLPCLQTLNLGGNNLGDEGMSILAPHLASLPCLQTLNLNLTGIGSEGIRTLMLHVACGACPQLLTLNLGWNHLGTEGMRVLASIPQLQTLDLRDNEISNEGMEVLIPYLASCPQLQNLYLWGNFLSLEEFANVQKQYPHIKIIL